jgi:hypothetical protein
MGSITIWDITTWIPKCKIYHTGIPIICIRGSRYAYRKSPQKIVKKSYGDPRMHTVVVTKWGLTCIQQLICPTFILACLPSLDDCECEGVASDENFSEFLSHCCPVNEKCTGKRANHLCIRTKCGTHHKDGAPCYHLVILREMLAPNNTGHGI